jgi:hypothetical protein
LRKQLARIQKVLIFFMQLGAFACVSVSCIDTCAVPVGAITISMTSTSGNMDFRSEFLDSYRNLPVLWHVNSDTEIEI